MIECRVSKLRINTIYIYIHIHIYMIWGSIPRTVPDPLGVSTNAMARRIDLHHCRCQTVEGHVEAAPEASRL